MMWTTLLLDTKHGRQNLKRFFILTSAAAENGENLASCGLKYFINPKNTQKRILVLIYQH